MSDFVHCNHCNVQPRHGKGVKFLLTSCYHLLCSACLEKAGADTPCLVCKKPMKVVEINRDMDPKLMMLFKPTKQLIAERLAHLKKKNDFQTTCYKSLLGHYGKQKEKLNAALKYCKSQAEEKKKQTKEMTDLKEWLTTAEQKLSECQTELKRTRDELEEAKKIDKSLPPAPPGDNPFESTLDKLFGEAGAVSQKATQNTDDVTFSLSQFGEQGDGNAAAELGQFQAMATTPNTSRMNTSDVSRSNSSMTMGMTMVSPALSTTGNSIISEVTTPKMLGLNKRGPSPANRSSLFMPCRLNPASFNREASGANPYMEQLLQQSQHGHLSRASVPRSEKSMQRTPMHYYGTPVLSRHLSHSHSSGSRPGSARRSPASRLATAMRPPPQLAGSGRHNGGSVTRGSIIPDVNSPANTRPMGIRDYVNNGRWE